jgi:hypothetical protein
MQCIILGNLTAGFDMHLPAGIEGLITCVTPDTGGLAIVPGPIEPLILSLKVEKPPESLLASVKSSLIWQPWPLLLLLTDTTGRLAV